MSLPRSVTIGGQKIKVKLQEFKDSHGFTYGQYFHDDKTIQINPDLCDQVKI